MQYVIAGVAVIFAVGLLFMTIQYYRAKQKGKGYVAVAAIGAIGTTWAAYLALLSVPWRAVIVLLFNGDPQLATALQPGPVVITASTFGLLIVSSFIYILASKTMRRGHLPINASAEEIEDLLGTTGLIALALAHVRFRLSGKADNPIRLPGESPYKLPDPQKQPDWTVLAADLLVQLEPNLIRETFRYVHERQLFMLSGDDVFDPTREISWLVCAISSEDSVPFALDLLDQVALTSKLDQRITLAICINATEHIDEVRHVPGHHEIRILSKTALVNKGLDLSFYVISLIRRFEQRVVPGADYTLSDCFVSPHFRRVRADKPSFNCDDDGEHDLLKYLEEWSARPGVDHISVIGEFGQGKSTALLAYCCNWANRWKAGDRSARVPLLIELRGKSPRRQAPDRFLAEWGDRYGLRGSALLNLIQSGRAIIIFEGFDEVQDAGLRYDRFEQFKALWSFSYPGTKIVFTGRPNFFLDTLERQTLLRDSQAARDAGLANSEILALSFLEKDGISRALSKYPPVTVQEILSQCDSDPAFMEIARRPSMLPVIGNQWPKIKAELQDKGGITSAAIVEYFIDFLYARKEADQDKLGEYQLLTRELRHYFTQRVAWKMLVERQKNTIDKHQFLQAVGDAYRSLDAEFRMDEEGRADIAGTVRKLKEVFRETIETDVVATIATDVRTNGLFAPDPAGGRDNLYFPHKQYFEFILGQIFVEWSRSRNNHSWLRTITPDEMVECLEFEPVATFFAAGLLTTPELDNMPRLSALRRLANLWESIITSIIVNFALLIIKRKRTTGVLWKIYEVVRICPLSYRHVFIKSGRRIGIQFRSYFPLFWATATMTSAVVMIGVIWVLFSASAMDRIMSGAVDGDRQFLTLSVVAATATMMSLVFVTLRLGMVLTPFPSTLVDYHLLMQLYRCDAITDVLRRNGPEAHAALICLIAIALPSGAVELPGETVARAFRTLGYAADEVFPVL